VIGHFLEHEPSPSAAIRGTVAVLLIVAIVSTLWVPLYARSMPKLGPFPFFYWYQLIWVPLTAALCWIGCLLLRSKPARSARPAAPVFGYVTYIAITALILNLIVAAALTPVFRRIGLHNGYDETRPADSFADPATMPATASGAGDPWPSRRAGRG
jgi:hypothetical protein